ncbi:restriction endonuclease subunit S [Phocaeicola vulgatus]|uniref:restriction endonuclease subunit S n=2 Tax=Phocaeicola vulgatus TaxID=821 RepID=UPI001C2C5E63|nr:restriction endonuclease subunit S [Phocaeicola vulgatus]MBU9914089.1 restriction endonuclease subunit S [Phocaeicola vulgatus]
MTNNKDKKVLNVPNLRFPEFTEEWKKVRVSNLLDFYPTNSLSWEQLDYSNGQIKNLHYGLIHKGLPTMVDASSDLLPYIKEEIVPKSYTLFKEGDVSFADASEDTNDVAKAIEILNCNGQQIVSGLHTIHGRDNTDQTVIGYKGYAFASESFHKQIRRIAQGTKVFSVSVRNFDETYIGVPSKDEQAKIAKLLIAIDKRIATQNKIIEKLQSLIKGLNDSLYKQYGNAITTSFSDLGHSYSGLSGKSSEDFGSGKPFITYLNVYSNNVVNENEYQYVRINDGEKQNIVQCGDVLFTLSSETPEEVGVGSVYLGIDEVFLNSFCFGFHIDNKELAYPPYFSYYVSSTPFRKFIYPFAQGSTRFNLCKADFEKASIKLPSLNNQKHIYAILNSITGKIETEKNLLEYYTTQKQYLLRQMFI